MRLIRHSAGEQHYYVYMLLVFSFKKFELHHLYTYDTTTTVAVFANLLPLMFNNKISDVYVTEAHQAVNEIDTTTRDHIFQYI